MQQFTPHLLPTLCVYFFLFFLRKILKGYRCAEAVTNESFLNTAIVAPTPNGNFTAELHYSFLPQSIVDAATGTSWLGDNATNALLYGSLVQAYIFMKGEPDIIQQYQQQFEIAVGQLKKEGEGFNRTDAYRTGQASISTK